MDSSYLIDNYVNTKAGEPYRLFPFGRIVKNGKAREITPEYAAKFKLPHFKPPVKLGSHNDETPAGGHIIGLEVRQDGLYAIPQWNDKGEASMRDGAYRYHSPEVLWDESGIENPEDGTVISGPLILGDALLHTPHLGEKTAFYSFEKTGDTMSDENITMPKSFYDKFIAPLMERKPETQVIEKQPEDYEATKIERDEYKAKLEKYEAEQAKNELFNGVVKSLQDKEKFGSMFIELKAAEEAAGVMSGMSPEQREWCMRNFSALVAQIDESKLTEEKGKDTQAESDPKAAFNAAVLAVANEKKIKYNAAFEEVKVSQPDLFKSAFGK